MQWLWRCLAHYMSEYIDYLSETDVWARASFAASTQRGSRVKLGMAFSAEPGQSRIFAWVESSRTVKRKQPNDFFLCLCAWVELGWGRREQPNMSLVLQCGSQSRLFYWYAVSPITVLLVPSPLLSPLQYLYSACCYLSCFHPSSHWLLLWYCYLLLL